ncbi:aminotransferase class V-fold PLP-dependent enzyme [Jatrophihabitans sp. DSM 45814]
MSTVLGDPVTDQLAPANAALSTLVGAEQVVPLVDGRQVRYANLDYAASAPALQVVADQVNELLPWYSSVHRGAGYPSQVCTAAYESARTTVAHFVGAREADVVIFTRNTTDAVNLLATAAPGPVVYLDIEHHANLLPWQVRDGRVVLARNTLAETVTALEAELARTPAALLAVTGASNVTGELLPLALLADVAHRHGARIAVDGAQLVPHRRVDIADVGVDYIAFSGHKLYAPFGSGALIGRRDWLDAAAPYLAGGGAVRHVTIDSTDWTDSPARHEAGTPNVIGAVALAAACRAIRDLSEAALIQHEAALLRRLDDGLAEVGACSLRLWGDEAERVGMVTFTLPGFSPELIAQYLSAEHGIGVRDGRFCAHPLLTRFGADRGAVRASVGLGTTTADIDRLLEALASLAANGPSWTYELVDGALGPSPDPRTSPNWLAGDESQLPASPCATT